VVQPTREAIASLVVEHGGLHKSEICRQTGRGWGTIGYHLSVLAKEDRIRLEPHGQMLWAFKPGITEEDRRLIVTLSEQGRNQLLDELSKRDVATIRELSNSLSESQKVVRTHVSHLMAVGAVERTGERPHKYSAVPSLLQRIKFRRP
jgi:predicted transcriptional regulator